MTNNQELLDIVDENDNVIGQDTRENIHKKSKKYLIFLKLKKNFFIPSLLKDPHLKIYKKINDLN